MKKLKSFEIRQMWLDFFNGKKHEVIPSASLIPNDDPTLLWINSGVAPLKKYFDGREKPRNLRMCNAQKSIRTNDIENVGKTARHHTFFEMLGNFSIGDYFRDDALTWAYEILFSPNWYHIDKELIYITYYPDDLETYQKWLSLGISDDHLIPLKGNFWEIGEGPCGPDTEIFFDRGTKYDPNNLGITMLKEDIENDRYIEIWNIVFSQFNSITGLERDHYPELPSKNIDTGCGLERLACVFQEVETNYETDLFMPMILEVESITHRSYINANSEEKMAFRVIVDHIRSITFAVADGAIISNDGRGYVLRRILRRAVRMGRKLGINEPFLYKIVDIVNNTMKSFYSYLEEKVSIIRQIVKNEEENFLKTLESGEKKLLEILKNSKNKIINGENAFLLYDTFGFPIELTIEYASELGYNVDIVSFQAELNKQRQRARSARIDDQSMNYQNEEFLNYEKEAKFIGYDNLTITSNVQAIFSNGHSIDKGSNILQIVFNETPFYSEGGGQIGDIGVVELNNCHYEVINTVKLPNGQPLHTVDMKDSWISIGDIVTLKVNRISRERISANHSATHILNQALRNTLGNHVIQQGSFVSGQILRFDFNHYQNLLNDDILAIESEVNRVINSDLQVNIIETTIEDAKKMGAQALFGEKYGDLVRMVDMQYCLELCGGTHVKRTSEIKQFAILNIESKGSGIFRIEAITGNNIINEIKMRVSNFENDIIAVQQKTDAIYQMATVEGFNITKKITILPAIGGSYQDIINYRHAVDEVRKNLKDLEREYDTKYREKNAITVNDYANCFYRIGDTEVLIEKIYNKSVEIIKDIVDKLSANLPNCLIFIAGIPEQDTNKIIFIAKSKGNNHHCGNLVKEAAIICGGNGGGKSDFAQAGGKNISKIDDAINRIKELII